MLFFLSLASAQTFDTTPGNVRSYEIESWQTMRTEAHPWGTDWTVPEFQVWAGIVDCTMGEKRYESCRWRDDTVYWGFGDAPEQIRTLAIRNSSEMELHWNAMGKLTAWDVRGKGRQTFWLDAANTQLAALYHRSDVVYTDDSVRRIGPKIEESLLKSTVGWLEVQWPKKPGPTWAPKGPITGARYLRYGVASAKMTYEVLPDGRWKLNGHIVEDYNNRGNVETGVAAVYEWNGNQLGAVAADAIHGSSTVPLAGHRRTMVQIHPVTADSDPTPNRQPIPLFK